MSILLCAFAVDAHLPGIVISTIEKPRNDFKLALLHRNKEQYELILQRYAELLPESPLFFGLDLDIIELYDHLKSRFPFKASVERRPRELSEFGKSNVAALLKAFSGKHRGRLLELKVTCDDDQLLLPFEVVDERNRFDLKLRGVPIPQGDIKHHREFCLDLAFVPKKRSADLGWLGTQITACPLPPIRAGDCLLSTAEKLSRALDMREISLSDFTEARCSKNKRFAMMRILRIFQDGQSWYEKKDYVPFGDFETYKKKLEAFVDYKISSLKHDLDVNKGDADKAKFVKDKITEYQTTPSASDKAAQFMAWLWNDDCSAYLEAEELLFGLDSYYEIKRLYPDVGELSKKLK